MKLHQSKILSHYKRFKWSEYIDGRYWKPRDCLGMLLYWKVCDYFQPKTILEIGFFEGLTFGLMFEATSNDSKYLCIDSNLSTKQAFDILFDQDPKYSSIEFIESDSKDVHITGKYDLVHIDGDHSYSYVKNDLEKILPCLHKNSILIIDDATKDCPDVSKIIDEYLLGQNDFVPFLAGDREIFFHHVSHCAEDFLDNYLTNNFRDVVCFFNEDYKGFTVLKGWVPNFFNDNEFIFFDQLRKYDV
jgi:predicted O-methyltransferase YrrM